LKTTAETISIPKEKYEYLLSVEGNYTELSSKFLSVSARLSELERMIFGRKSERFISCSDSNQLSLLDQEEVQETTPAPTEVEVSYKRKKIQKNKAVRKALPAHLERVIETIEPVNLSTDAEKIGEEVSEQYEYTPGKLFVKQTIRPKYIQIKSKEQSSLVESKQIVIAPVARKAFPKSNLGNSLATHISVSKYVDHQPIYRQRQIFSRENVHISASTIDGWLAVICKLLEPLYGLLIKKVQATDYLQADESTIKVLIDKKEKQLRNKKKSQLTGYYWVAHAVLEKLVVFRYYDSRKADCAIDLIGEFEGLLQTDGYKGYDQLASKEGITHLACLAHVRRYFEKALATDPVLAAHCMEVIQKLYAIEKSIHQAPMPNYQTIESYRELKAKPLLEEWFEWLKATLLEIAPKVRKEDKLLVAINYTLARWDKIVGYLAHGRALIDNNAIENKIRPLALGRKNYLFAGSHQGAKRGAMMYSFFACCKLNGVNPSKWLNHVFEIIPTINIENEEKMVKLLPDNFQCNDT